MNRRQFLRGGLYTVGALALGGLPFGVSAEAADIPGRADAIRKSAEEWRALLEPQEYAILFEGDTERAFTGRYWDSKANGVYTCAACALPLFDSRTKFKSGTGWPSFYDKIGTDNVAEKTDRSWFMVRTEVLCNRCGGHLGHVFDDGPAPTGKRYCINGYALKFVPREEVRAKKP